jgi:hypothetical protein
VPPDRLETRARRARKEPRGRPEHRVCKEKQEQLAALGWRAPTEKSVKQEQRGLRAKSGLLVLKGCRESKAKSARQGKQEPLDPKEKPVWPVLPEKLARPVLRALRVK